MFSMCFENVSLVYCKTRFSHSPVVMLFVQLGHCPLAAGEVGWTVQVSTGRLKIEWPKIPKSNNEKVGAEFTNVQEIERHINNNGSSLLRKIYDSVRAHSIHPRG